MLNQETNYNDIVDKFVGSGVVTKTLTFQVTESCSLCCTYCYQGHKSPARMDFETAKKMIDSLFEHRKDPDYYFSEETTKGLIIEFIGGEPLLEIKLIRQIVDYMEVKFAQNLDCPWSILHRYCITSNGVAYSNPEVQEFLNEYKYIVSISITVDGCKELHDKCRLFPDGSGSYDLAIAAALAGQQQGSYGTKITLSPDNVGYTYDGITNMLELGFWCIHINPVFEEGWQIHHATELYYQLKRVADYIKEHDIADKCYIALFDPVKYTNEAASDSADDKNWCGTTTHMLALDYHGDIYSCIRFMPSSIGEGLPSMRIGNLLEGIGQTEDTAKVIRSLNGLTKSKQSTSECLNCPIEKGCAWCTGYNYQKFGTIERRATFICDVHKAAALAAKYFAGLTGNMEDYHKIGVNEEIAKCVIPDEEWEIIKAFGKEVD